jgi:hypothetical protein
MHTCEDGVEEAMLDHEIEITKEALAETEGASVFNG